MRPYYIAAHTHVCVLILKTVNTRELRKTVRSESVLVSATARALYLSVEYQVLPPTSSVWTEIRSRQPQDVIASSYIVIKPLLKGYDYFVVGMYVIYYQI